MVNISGDSHTFDVFISYSHVDGDWVWNWLVPRLKAESLSVCIDLESFDVALPIIVNMENAVAASRHVVLVLTPDWVKSEATLYEELLTRQADPGALRRKTVPVLREPCEVPRRIAGLWYADLRPNADTNREFAKLLDCLRGVRRVPDAPTVPLGDPGQVQYRESDQHDGESKRWIGVRFKRGGYALAIDSRVIFPSAMALFMLVLILLVLVSITVRTVTIIVVTASKMTPLGQLVEARVEAKGRTEVTDMKFVMKFDPRSLEVVDADPYMPGVQVKAGQIVSSASILTNTVDNVGGTIVFEAAQPGHSTSLTGLTTLMTIPFRPKAPGSSQLAFSSVQLLGRNGRPIKVTSADGDIVVVPTDTPSPSLTSTTTRTLTPTPTCSPTVLADDGTFTATATYPTRTSTPTLSPTPTCSPTVLADDGTFTATATYPTRTSTPTLSSTPTPTPTTTPSATLIHTPTLEPIAITIRIQGLDESGLNCSRLVFYKDGQGKPVFERPLCGSRVQTIQCGDADWFKFEGSPNGKCPWDEWVLESHDPKHIAVSGEEVILKFCKVQKKPTEHETPKPEPTEHETPKPEPTEHETPKPEPTEHETPKPEPTEYETPKTQL